MTLCTQGQFTCGQVNKITVNIKCFWYYLGRAKTLGKKRKLKDNEWIKLINNIELQRES